MEKAIKLSGFMDMLSDDDLIKERDYIINEVKTLEKLLDSTLDMISDVKEFL